MQARYRANLPQLGGALFLTDGGIETTLIYHDGIDLPYFAAFDLLREQRGREVLEAYYRRHLDIALKAGCGFVLESATWRANPDWAAKLGYDTPALDVANREAVAMLHALRDRFETASTPCVVSGCVGPRGDGYVAGQAMTVAEAEAYHAPQIASLAGAGADLVTAITMTNTPEAIGVARAAARQGIPSAISFTVETDGRLPSGEPLGDAIEAVDSAAAARPAYFMLNCAHPTHFEATLAQGGAWLGRIRGLRANASRLSHAELDQATKLDDGDPLELGRDYRQLMRLLPGLNVMGGCCGTDHRHVQAIYDACHSVSAAA